MIQRQAVNDADEEDPKNLLQLRMMCVPCMKEIVFTSILLGAFAIPAIMLILLQRSVNIIRNVHCQNTEELRQYVNTMRSMRISRQNSAAGNAIKEARDIEQEKIKKAAAEREKQLAIFRAQEHARLIKLGRRADNEHQDNTEAGPDQPSTKVELMKAAMRETEIQNQNQGTFTLERSILALSSEIVVWWTLYSAYSILMLRMTVINRIPQEIAMILSILTIFIAGIGGQVKEKIKEPSRLISASVIFKCLKAVMIIVVFTCNGNMNDYFVAFFFVATSMCGLIYLRSSGYELPEDLSPEEEDNPALILRNKILTDLVFELQDAAFYRIVGLATVLFLTGLVTIYQSVLIFGPSTEVSTMGVSAIIMIMINAISWPNILEALNKQTRLHKIKDHKERAKAFLKQIDEMVDFCSGLMNQIQDLAGTDEQKKVERAEDETDEAHRMHLKALMDTCVNQKEHKKQCHQLVGGICRISDAQKVTLVECNLKLKNPYAPDDLRFEGDEELGNSKLEELCVFDNNVYVQFGGVEYVFREGIFFAEEQDHERDLNVRTYILIVPSDKAPLILHLTPKLEGETEQKLVLTKAKKAIVPKADKTEEKDMTKEQKAAKRKREIQEEAARYEREKKSKREKMIEISNPSIENNENYILDPDWLTKFIDTNGPQIIAGHESIDKLDLGVKGIIQFHLQDYTGRLDVKEVMRLTEFEGKRYFERLQNKQDNLIEAALFYTDKFMVVKMYRKQIYVFVKGGLFTQDELKANAIESSLKGKSGVKDQKEEIEPATDAPLAFAYRLLTHDRGLSLVLHCRRMTAHESVDYQQRQFFEKTLDIFNEAQHPDKEVFYDAQDYNISFQPVNWLEFQDDGKAREIRELFELNCGGSKYQGEWLLPQIETKGGLEFPPDGVEGRVANSLKYIDGRGVYISKGGYRYDGFFKAGKRHGHGREIRNDLHTRFKWIYQGRWANDCKMPENAAVQQWSEQHSQILKEGWAEVLNFGVSISDSVKASVAYWLDSKEGIFDWSKVGKFNQKLHIRNVVTRTSQAHPAWRQGLCYLGEWTSDLSNISDEMCPLGVPIPEGRGIMIYHDGSVYFGQFKDGKRSGLGRLIEPRDEFDYQDLSQGQEARENKAWYGIWDKDRVKEYAKVEKKKEESSLNAALTNAFQSTVKPILEKWDKSILDQIEKSPEEDLVALGNILSPKMVTELREINKLDTDKFYFLGEWDLTHNRPGGRCYFYSLKEEFYCGTIEYSGSYNLLNETASMLSEDYQSLDFLTGDQWKGYMSRECREGTLIISADNTRYSDTPEPWKGKFKNNKKYKLSTQKKQRQEQERLALLKGGLEALKKSGKLKEQVYQKAIKFDTHVEESYGDFLDWSWALESLLEHSQDDEPENLALIGQSEITQIEEKNKPTKSVRIKESSLKQGDLSQEHEESHYPVSKITKQKNKAEKGLHHQLLIWKDLRAPNRESRDLYLGEWIQNEPVGPDEPFGRGFVIFTDGSLYFGTVKYDSRKSCITLEQYGRYIPIDDQEAPWAGYWEKSRKQHLPIRIQNVAEQNLLGILRSLSPYEKLVEKFGEPEFDCAGEDSSLATRVEFAQKQFQHSALELPERGGEKWDGKTKEFPFDCRHYREFINDWIEIEPGVYWLGQWIVGMKKSDNVPDGRGWRYAPASALSWGWFSRGKVQQGHGVEIPTSSKFLIPIICQFQDGISDASISLGFAWEENAVKWLNQWEDALTAGGVDEYYINKLKQVGHVWELRDIAKDFAEWDSLNERQVQRALRHVILPYRPIRHGEENGPKYYGEWERVSGADAVNTTISGRGYLFRPKEGFYWGEFLNGKLDGQVAYYPAPENTKQGLYNFDEQDLLSSKRWNYFTSFEGTIVEGEKQYTDEYAKQVNNSHIGLLRYYLMKAGIFLNLKDKLCRKNQEQVPKKKGNKGDQDWYWRTEEEITLPEQYDEDEEDKNLEELKRKINANKLMIPLFKKQAWKGSGMKGVYFGEVHPKQLNPHGRGILILEPEEEALERDDSSEIRTIFYGWFKNGKRDGYGRLINQPDRESEDYEGAYNNNERSTNSEQIV